MCDVRVFPVILSIFAVAFALYNLISIRAAQHRQEKRSTGGNNLADELSATWKRQDEDYAEFTHALAHYGPAFPVAFSRNQAVMSGISSRDLVVLTYVNAVISNGGPSSVNIQDAIEFADILVKRMKDPSVVSSARNDE